MACPVCARETDPKYRPFCSRRCADVDLGRWLNESYRLPETEAEADPPPPPEPPQPRQ